MRAPTIVPADKMSCSECSTPLSAVETWSGRRLLQCGKMKCRRSAQKRGPKYEYAFANTTTCEGPDCDNFVPEGTYDFRAKFKVCSGACFRKVRDLGARSGSNAPIAATGIANAIVTPDPYET
jgi:hypothetical protein